MCVNVHSRHAAAAHCVVAYSADAIYLYSTRDDPQSTSIANAESAILQPNKKQSSRTKHSHSPETTTTQDMLERDTRMEEDIERIFADSTSSGSPEENTPLLGGAMDENEDDIDDDMAVGCKLRVGTMCLDRRSLARRPVPRAIGKRSLL